MACTQPLLIHSDGSGSCSVPGRLDHDTLTEAVLRHRVVVNCQAVLGTRCTVCHRAETDRIQPSSSGDLREGETIPMRPGLAVVHADLSLECSQPNCEMIPSRGAWLARHADVRSCGDLDEACVVCSISDRSVEARPGNLPAKPARNTSELGSQALRPDGPQGRAGGRSHDCTPPM